MFGLDLGKYRTMVLSIALFLLFDLGVLVLNFAISSQIKDDAINVNLVGRQRMLTQRITKTALQIEDRIKTEQPYRDLMLELDRASSMFNQTLIAYRTGGIAPGGDGQDIRREPLNDEKANQILDDTQAQWQPYFATIKEVLKANPPTAEQASSLAQQSEIVNTWLLSLTNDFTTRVEELASSKATTLRSVQIAGISLATMNFLLIMFHFVRHLRESDRKIEHARKETDDILRTTQEGLFLLGTDYRMGTQQSSSLATILGMPCPPGTSFLELLRPLVTQKTFDTAREYIDLLLRHDVKEKLVASLNPLDCMEVSVNRSPGVAESRFLQFRFNRVMDAGQVTHLLVTANDITRRVRLESDLRASEERAQGQMGLVLQILQVDPHLMEDFLKTASEGVDHINRILETQPSGVETFANKINAIHRIAHRIKGDAAGLNLAGVAQSFHMLEDILGGLRERPTIVGEDLLPIAVRVKQLYAELGAIQNVLNRMAQIRGVVTVEPSKPAFDPNAANHGFVRQWRAFAEKLALKLGKHVDLSYQGLDIATLAPSQREIVISIVNQFIRNAMVHGIEKPDQRAARGKPELGRISVFIADGGSGGIELSFRDDGQGIDPAAIREAVVRAGRMTVEAAAQADMRTLISTIFEPGVTTRTEPDEDAGRGAGLDAVKDLVKQIGGNVRIGTTKGEYCHFRIHLPAPKEHTVAVPMPKLEAA